MSNYNSLKTTINANVKQNGRQEITGQILNSVLNQMVTTLGAGYQFAGVATTATNPGSPDAKMFYIANGKGTYTNFGGLVVTEDDVVVLYWDSSWHKVSTGIASQGSLLALDAILNGTEDEQVVEIESFQEDKYWNIGSATEGETYSKTNPGSFVGCRCFKIGVSAGEKYKIFGIGTSSAAGLYVLTGIDDIVIAKGGYINRRDNGELIEVSEDGYLYVNLASYASATDKVLQIVSIFVEGLVDKVDALESDIDDLETRMAELEYEVNGEDIATETELELNVDKFINTSEVFTALSPTYYKSSIGNLVGNSCLRKRVLAGEHYRLNTTPRSNTTATGFFILTGSEDIVLQSLRRANNNEYTFDIVEDGYLYVNFFNYDSSVDKFIQIEYSHEGGYKKYVDDAFDNHRDWVGKTIVCFGDSLTEFKDINGKRYSDYLELMSGATIINVGIGGAQLRQRTTPVENPTTSTQGYAGLDICNMVKAACEQDFTIAENCAIWVRDNASDDNTEIVERLKNIDWSVVDAVIIFAGANDYNNGRHLGTPDSYDVNNTLGAINYIIQALLTTYKKVKLYWFTPTVRWIASSLEERTEENWSDNRVTSEGKTLPDYVSAIMDLVKAKHIPVCDMYWTLGWNQYNFSNYFNDNDGTHPRKGNDVLSRKFFGFINANKTF